MSPAPSEPTVLDHLFDGRQALVDEIDRLSLAVEELDAVIARVGGEAPAGNGAARTARTAPTRGARTGRASAPARRSPAVATANSTGTKSIREHVLELLGSEQRDFGLAEIIDNVHAAGIQAHDDAVRSITIKLMKDGQVERVGRGHYRLAGSAPAVAAGGDTDQDDSPAPSQGADTDDGDNYTPPLNLGEEWDDSTQSHS